MDNCLIISDTHFPYAHKDWLKFVSAVADVYDVKIAKSSGDVADNHFPSYHEIEYGTLSAQDEYKAAYRDIQKLAELFPDLTVVIGNHDQLNTRKAKTAGIPEDYLKSYNDTFGVEWTWTDKDYFKINNSQNCLLTHSISSSTLNNAKVHSHCTIQGHHHGSYGIEYFADTETIRWSMTVGCLIDPHSPAFNYAKFAVIKRPILGVGLIVDDLPILQPMVLKKNGRWIGTL